jgi:septum site-determining protein MinC
MTVSGRCFFYILMNTESLALDFKSATLYAVRVVLHSADLERLSAALQKRMADAGSFFENEPVVIDASRLQEPVDWQALLAALRSHNLPPIGVVAEGAILEAALAAGLTAVELSTPPARPAQDNTAVTTGALDAPLPSIAAAGLEENATPAESAAPTDPSAQNTTDAPVENGRNAAENTPGDAPVTPAGEVKSSVPRLTRAARTTTQPAPQGARDPHSSSALVITKPLRSGQRVYARHCDLVVIGMVSQGAEVIADGNVHVYGPLRGKAMAGARGDTSARIFTTHMDAELLAVAGVYRVVEDRLDKALHNKPALVRLEGDTLHIEGLKA